MSCQQCDALHNRDEEHNPEKELETPFIPSHPLLSLSGFPASASQDKPRTRGTKVWGPMIRSKNSRELRRSDENARELYLDIKLKDGAEKFVPVSLSMEARLVMRSQTFKAWPIGPRRELKD